MSRRIRHSEVWWRREGDEVVVEIVAGQNTVAAQVHADVLVDVHAQIRGESSVGVTVSLGISEARVGGRKPIGVKKIEACAIIQLVGAAVRGGVQPIAVV